MIAVLKPSAIEVLTRSAKEAVLAVNKAANAVIEAALRTAAKRVALVAAKLVVLVAAKPVVLAAAKLVVLAAAKAAQLAVNAAPPAVVAAVERKAALGAREAALAAGIVVDRAVEIAVDMAVAQEVDTAAEIAAVELTVVIVSEAATEALKKTGVAMTKEIKIARDLRVVVVHTGDDRVAEGPADDEAGAEVVEVERVRGRKTVNWVCAFSTSLENARKAQIAEIATLKKKIVTRYSIECRKHLAVMVMIANVLNASSNTPMGAFRKTHD